MDSEQDQATSSLQKLESEPLEVSELSELIRPIIEQETRTQIIAHFQHESHSGPMPSPKQLAMYDAALPGTALAIREEFQANGAHVRKMETLLVQNYKDDSDKNRRVAERLVWGAFALILILAIAGYEKVAIAVALTTVGAVIAGFLNRRSKGKSEKEDVSNKEEKKTEQSQD